MSTTNLSRGSQWSIWDLHVHSPASAKNNQFRGATPDEKWKNYMKALGALEGISVLGITDYFSLEGFKRVQESIKHGELNNIALVIPNVELRLSPITKSGNPINAHILIKPDLIEIFESRILSALTFSFSDNQYHCTRSDLLALGRNFKRNDDLEEGAAFAEGIGQFNASLEQVRSLIQSNRMIRDNCLVGVSNNSEDGASGLRHSSLAAKRQDLYRFVDFIFSGNPKDRSYFLGAGSDDRDEIIAKFGRLKPCIHGSDAHALEDVGSPALDRYTWIKAEHTFDGLRQIIFEPEDRVHIGEESPENWKIPHTPTYFDMSPIRINEELSFKRTQVPLNRNLVIVTGGKGSGKTAFMDLIANHFEDRCRRSGEDKNSFIQRIEDEAQDWETELQFLGPNVNKQRKKLTDQEYVDSVKVTYLPQGRIEDFCGNRRGLDEKIWEIVFGNRRVLQQGFKSRLDDILTSAGAQWKEISKLNHEVAELVAETTEEAEEEIQKEIRGIKGRIKDKEQEIKDLGGRLDEKSQKKINSLKESQVLHEDSLEALQAFDEEIGALRRDIQEQAGVLNRSINHVNEIAGELLAEGEFEPIPEVDLKAQLDSIGVLVRQTKKAVNRLSKQIETSAKKVGTFSEIEQEQAKRIEEKQRLVKELQKWEKLVSSIMKKREKVKRRSGERDNKWIEILESLQEWKDLSSKVIGVFYEGQGVILEDITFSPVIFLENEQFLDWGDILFDRRSVSRESLEESLGLLRNALGAENAKTRRHAFTAYLESVEDLRPNLKSAYDHYDYLKWVYGNYFLPSTDIGFKGIGLDRLSIGQKATVLLKLVLAEGDSPVLVDQPEETLDNEFIYEELVDAIRLAKKNRQIIMATNNGNLVIATDAEQVVLTSFEEGVITYQTGTIEDPATRDRFTLILEGGQEAFTKRGERYGIRPA